MRNKSYFGNFILIIILECAFLTTIMSQQIITIPFAYSSSNGTQSLNLTGPINSIQYSRDGNASWILSGRWRMEVDSDSTGTVPLTIKRFDATIIGIPIDGSKTERQELSDFKQESQSYDNKTNISTIKGKITLPSKTQTLEDVGVVLKLINKNILTITLDPSKTRDWFGETPIYGIER